MCNYIIFFFSFTETLSLTAFTLSACAVFVAALMAGFVSEPMPELVSPNMDLHHAQ